MVKIIFILFFAFLGIYLCYDAKDLLKKELEGTWSYYIACIIAPFLCGAMGYGFYRILKLIWLLVTKIFR